LKRSFETGGAVLATENTRTQILDAAERLFGKHGFEGTSLRAVTSAADVNLAAVHYHFGSKEALLHASVARLVGPVNQERLKRLDQLEAAAGSGPLPLEPVLEALFRPVLEAGETEEERARLRHLAAKLYGESTEIVAPLLVEIFGGVALRFFGALSRALPDLPPSTVRSRLEFAIGVLIHTISAHQREASMPGIPNPLGDDETLAAEIIAFVAAGFRAPAPTPTDARPSGRRMPR
jgi:AcrR family transcriptional regulator